jgi:hypothetical protein
MTGTITSSDPNPPVVQKVDAAIATAKADVAVAKTKVEAIVAFVKAHYTKGVAAIIGFALSNFSVISHLVSVIKKVL